MITIQDFHFSYKRKKVFCGLDLRIQAGHIYGLLGSNGSGKSTLLRSIAGLLFPKRGKIEVLSAVPGNRDPRFLQQVFIIPEEFHLPDIRIDKYVRCNAPFYPAFDQKQFNSYLEEFGISFDNTLLQMSYGQKKKVLISFGLACNTPLLLMDEPTNGLDITGKNQFRKIIAGAVNEEKCIFISTHQVKDLDSLIDHILIIDGGKIIFDRSTEEISQYISVKLSVDKEEIARALYREESLKGNAIVMANSGQNEGQFDLELLYKAIAGNREAVLDVFNEQVI